MAIRIGVRPRYPTFSRAKHTLITIAQISMLAATLMDLVSLAIVVIYCNRESSFHGGSLADYFVKQGLGAFIAVTIVNVAAATAFFNLSFWYWPSPQPRFTKPRGEYFALHMHALNFD
ncbi:hypothetical protein H1R20_g15292, partial [Candolleomyces eurysporus]